MVVVFSNYATASGASTPGASSKRKYENREDVVRLIYSPRTSYFSPWEVYNQTYRYPWMKVEAEARKVADWLDQHRLKGVHRADPPSQQWHSFVVVNGRLIERGLHNTMQDAARAHDKMLLTLKGHNAWSMLNFPSQRSSKVDGVLKDLLSSLHDGYLDVLHKGRWARRAKRPRAESKEEVEEEEEFAVQMKRRCPEHIYSRFSQQELHIVILRRLVLANTARQKWEQAGAALLAYWKLLCARSENSTIRLNLVVVPDWQVLLDAGIEVLWQSKGHAFALRFLRSSLAFLEYFREHYDDPSKAAGSSYYLQKIKRVESPGMNRLRQQIIVSMAVMQRGNEALQAAATMLDECVQKELYKQFSQLCFLAANYLVLHAASNRKMQKAEQMEVYLRAMKLLKQGLQDKKCLSAGKCLLQLVRIMKTTADKRKFGALSQSVSSQGDAGYTTAHESEEEDAEKAKSVSKMEVASATEDGPEGVEAVVDSFCQENLRDPDGWQAKVACAEGLPGRELAIIYDLQEWRRADPLNPKAVKQLVQQCLKQADADPSEAFEFASEASSFTGRQLLKIAYEALVDSLEHLSFTQSPPWSVTLNPNSNPGKPKAFVVYLWETLVEVMTKTKPDMTKEIFGLKWRRDLWQRRFFDSVDANSIAQLTTRQQKLLHAQYEVAYRALGSSDEIVTKVWKLIS